MTANAAIDIPNLLYRYADAMDAADFDAAAAMFDHGHLLLGNEKVSGREKIAELWRSIAKVHPDGTLRTRHITTNPIIELSDDGQSARCQSQWTVLQATETLPLQVIGTGRYHDRLAIIDGKWTFTERRYARVDLAGNSAEHLYQPLEEGSF